MIRSLIPSIIAVLLSFPVAGQETYIPNVELIERDHEWWVLKDGRTIKLHGAGVASQQSHLLDYLASKGGVVTRTWGTNNIGDYLDRAYRNGIGVIVGFWMGHERRGFDYSDPKQVADQEEKARKAIREYRDHAAVVMWSIGNEMESGAKDPDLVYHALSDLVAAVKEEDDRRPVITVVADITKDKIKRLNRIVALVGWTRNQQLWRNQDAGTPCDEVWVGKAVYRDRVWPARSVGSEEDNLEGADRADQLAEGGAIRGRFRCDCHTSAMRRTIAFIWGWRAEATPTWYGMFLKDGFRLGAVDALQERWTGSAPRRRAPRIKSLVWPGDPSGVAPGASIDLSAEVVSREVDRLSYSWSLIRESAYRKEKVDGDLTLEMETQGSTVSFSAPAEAGTYRLSVIVKSRRRTAATANIPFRIIEIEDR